MNNSKTFNLLVEKLASKNSEDVLFAINKIRSTGNPDILPHLVRQLDLTDNKEIKSTIIQVLNDLKIQSAIPVIIDLIVNSKSEETKKILLTSIWQSGLNYSVHLPYLVDLFIKESFEIAFEAFTIIENIDLIINNNIIEPLIVKLKQSKDVIVLDKHDLLAELVQILENLKSE